LEEQRILLNKRKTAERDRHHEFSDPKQSTSKPPKMRMSRVVAGSLNASLVAHVAGESDATNIGMRLLWRFEFLHHPPPSSPG
jgi:hypothetical protein